MVGLDKYWLYEGVCVDVLACVCLGAWMRSLQLGHGALSSALCPQYWHQGFEGATKVTGFTFSDTLSGEESRPRAVSPIRNKKMSSP